MALMIPETMSIDPAYNQPALQRLAACLLRYEQTATPDEARAYLFGQLGAYHPAEHTIERALDTHFAAQ